MTDLPHLIDYAWTHPAPANIKAAGYQGVVRYLSNDSAKNLTAPEAAGLHAHGLTIRLVWETTADRALQGHMAGWSDRRAAEKQARALGYPLSCPIFYAVDSDADPAKVAPYFRGLQGGRYPVGVYGSLRVTTTMFRWMLARYLWQTEAWSGTAVDPLAHLYQRVKPTLPHIQGVPEGSYDENTVLRFVPAWTPTSPKPKPAVEPTRRWWGWRWIWPATNGGTK